MIDKKDQKIFIIDTDDEIMFLNEAFEGSNANEEDKLNLISLILAKAVDGDFQWAITDVHNYINREFRLDPRLSHIYLRAMGLFGRIHGWAIDSKFFSNKPGYLKLIEIYGRDLKVSLREFDDNTY